MTDSRSTNKPNLSVVILARDAAPFIAATIASAKAIAQEVIVCDTGSNDDTAGQALFAGAKVIHQPWQENFSAARNAAMAHATGKWILWLDAGESLAEEESAQLVEFLTTQADDNTAYWMFVAVPVEGHNVGGEQVARVRLHPRRTNLKFTGRVRETLLPSLTELGIGVEGLRLHIQRGPREHDSQVKQARAERNINLAEKEMMETGPRPELWNTLGEAYQVLGRFEESSACYRQGRIAASPKSAQLLEAYYGILTTLDAGGEERQQQLQLCMEAVEHFPLDSQLLCAMGGYLQALGHDELALRSYDVASKHGRIEPMLWHLPNILELAASCHAALLSQRGKVDAAIGVLEQGLQMFPDSSRLLLQQMELQVQQGNRDGAVETLKRMPMSDLQREMYATALQGACEAARQNWIAARAYLETAYNAGLVSPICYRWLCETYLALGQIAAAEVILEAWREADPRSKDVRDFRHRLQNAPPQSADDSRRIDPPLAEQKLVPPANRPREILPIPGKTRRE